MANNRLKKNTARNSAFAIQLFECAMVAVLFNLSFSFAGKLIYNNAFPFGLIDGLLLYAMMSAIAIIILGANKYFSFISRPFSESATRIVGLVIMMNFIFIALLYFSRSIRLSPYYFTVADTYQILFLILIKRLSGVLKAGILKKRVSLVIGKDQKKNELIRELRKQGIQKLAFVSFEDEKLKDYLDKADNIYLTGLLSKRMKDRIINYCILRDKRIFVVPETYEIAMRKSEMTQIGDIPLFAVESFRLTEAQNIIKRLIDLVLSIIGILLTLPIMLFASIRIKMEDRGPIFYRQTRSGLNGKEFEVIKFRSMVVDAEKETGAVFASENDPRITKIGHLMRAVRIDEIPQFFNVLKGSMSMIGPRPERPQFVEEYSKELPEYSSRLAVKPGITGLAQVMGNYTTSAENKAKFDLVYIRDYSLFLDFKILFKTIKVVFTKSQSKGFIAHDFQCDYDLEADITKVGAEEKKSYRNHKLGKAALVIFCSFIVIFGCMILRYSALTTTMIEAAALPASEGAESGELEAVTENLDSIAIPVSNTIPDENATMWTEADDSDAGFSGQGIVSVNQENELRLFAGSYKRKTVSSDTQGEVVLSQKKIDDAMDQMPMSEKMGIAYNLIARLSAEDLMKLDKLSEDGFTEEEKIKAKEMMYRYYNDAEVEYIKEIYWEYVE